MAVPEQTPYIEYTSNGLSRVFALGFQCDNKAHLIVTIDDVEPLYSSWSLTGDSVTFNTAPASGKKITIQRNTPFERTSEYQNYNQSFRPQTVNADFDRIWLKLQELGVSDWLLRQYVDKKNDELKAFLLEEIRKQGVALDQLEDYYNALMQKLAEIAINGGWTDSVISTWSGRTQESKNKDSITGLDIGVGDGVTSDAAKFTAFESQYSNVVVDLLGKTYVVNELPTKNLYKNGYFKKDGKLLISNGFYEDVDKSTDYVLDSVNDNLGLKEQRWRLVPDSYRPAAADNALQTMCTDEKRGLAYTLQNTQSNNTEHGYISRYHQYQPDGNYTATDSMRISPLIGHQGLSVEFETGMLWAQGATASLGALRFEYNPNGVLQNYDYYKLHPTLTMMPTVSYDQKWLIATKPINSTDQIIRVFDLAAMLKRGAGDHSAHYSYEFTLKNFYQGGIVYTQGIACDGNYIYTLSGRFTAYNTPILSVFTLNGRLVRQVKNFNVGVADSWLMNSSYYEPESIHFARIEPNDAYPSLIVGIANEQTGLNRVNLLYTLGYNTGITSILRDRVEQYIGGRMAFGIPYSPTIDEYNNPRLTLCAGSTDGTNFAQLCYADSDSSRPNHTFARAKGNLSDGFASVGGSTQLGRTVYKAFAGGKFNTAAGYVITMDADPVGTTTPAKIEFYTTNTAGTTNPRFRINNDGSCEALSSNIATYSMRLAQTGTGSTLLSSRAGVVTGGIHNSPTNYHQVGRNGAGICLSIATSDTDTPAAVVALPNTKDRFVPADGLSNVSLGSASNKWSVVYASTGSINTSDERLKQQFRSLDEREKAAALEIKNSICLYKFNDAVDLKGDGARWHVGVKAQQIISILESHDLDAMSYAFVCFDEWEAKEPIIENGITIEQGIEAGSRYAVRYDELSMFILSAI